MTQEYSLQVVFGDPRIRCSATIEAASLEEAMDALENKLKDVRQISGGQAASETTFEAEIAFAPKPRSN